MDWKQLVVERDGITPCFARIGGAIGAAFLVGLEGLSIYHGHDVDSVQFATAWTMLVVGVSGAARIKLTTEAPS